jgi:flagellar biosynthesis protein FlhF
MAVRKFFGASTREALRHVRDVLGADALILSNRQMPGGVEIMAVAETEVASMVAAPVAVPERGNAAPAAQLPDRYLSRDAVTTQDLVNEVRLLRGMVEGQLAGFAWKDLSRGSPVQIELIRELMGRGFSPGFARGLSARVPTLFNRTRALRWARQVLAASLRCVSAGEDIVSRGGVYAFVGPTGVGKTTTVAKLAASCTLRHGAHQLALVTTDSYRIGAVDQLRIYGKILGVPVFAVKDEQDLAVTLAELRGRKLVLIDTVGMSQRDKRVAEQVALLTGHGRNVQRLLLLSAVAQGDALEDTVRRYRGEGLAGCVLTKVDEALSLGSAVDVIVRSKLPLHYVTNGQRVPEDLHLASALYLVERAFRGEPPAGAFRAGPEEAPLAYAARARATTAAAHGS